MKLPISATLIEAAKTMRDKDDGAVIVMNDQAVCGIVTDRDLVVRGMAMGSAADKTKLGDI
ncbi:MAG: CBS domain-containing protein [Actinomycetota bacterium]